MFEQIFQHADSITDLVGSVGDLLAQQGGDPYGGGNPYGGSSAEPWMDESVDSGPSFGIGQFILMILIGVGINVLFGFWAKSRGDDHGIHPGLSFAAGFFLNWIGVLIVPLLKTDRVLNMPNRRPPPPQQPYGQPGQHPQNPMYTAGGGAYQPPPPPGGPPPQPPQGPMLNQPQSQPPQGPTLNQPQGQPPQGPMLTPQQGQPQGAPPQPQPSAPPPGEPAQMLVADEHGYVECPACSARTKAGRKACMSCGSFLPPVYDPNAGR